MYLTYSFKMYLVKNCLKVEIGNITNINGNINILLSVIDSIAKK